MAKETVKEKETRDHWSPDGQVFIHYSQGYTVSPSLKTVCIGPVGDEGRPLGAAETPLTGDKDRAGGVTKPPTKGIVPPKDIQAQDGEVLLQKNKGGRPKKAPGESVSRMTEWRREKEKQGVLL